MFKKAKDLAETSRSRMKNKDVKAMRRQLESDYPHLTPKQVALLLPQKAALTSVKTACKAVLYVVGDDPAAQPMFFDPDGRGNTVLPTVFALWRVPTLMPALVIHPQVSHYVMRGADLMRPGILVPPGGLEPCRVNERRCVVARGNPMPLAVGLMECGSEQMEAEGMGEGKALRVLHHFRDQLWSQFGKGVPNDGFLPKEVRAIDGQESSEEEDGSEEDGEGEGDGEEDNGCKEKEEGGPGRRGDGRDGRAWPGGGGGRRRRGRRWLGWQRWRGR